VRYGFVIDHRRCIGCHACTVACKEENRVPLGAFRTWVKYVERGTFPDTRRYFSVLRCNHCDDAPCVTICPTVALYRRPDGIVDFDNERCIGCKSCMQACPYDALYIDPDTHTAAKCHYCAHRLEVGLEPACVIVCPERAIIAGDLDDPRTEIARLVAREQVEVRKPEQGTRPKVFYVGADSSTLSPPLQRPGTAYLWGERPAAEVDLVKMVVAAQDQHSGGDGSLSRAVYDVPHAPRPWGWRVSTYLWTKSIAAGVLLVAAFGDWSAFFTVAAPALSLAFLALTTVLLIADLKRPDRFAYILLKPNWRSWLVWGAWILIAFGGAGALWLLGGLMHHRTLLTLVTGPAVLLAVAAAGYSAFLFGQAEGRDFWQSPLVLPHLIVSAVVAGLAAGSLLAAAWPPPTVVAPCPEGILPPSRCLPGRPLLDWLLPPLSVALVLHLTLLLVELLSRHPARDATLAARLLTGGGLRHRFWAGVVLGGVVAPLVLIVIGTLAASTPLVVLAAALALVGLWLWEDLWVRAGQSIPLS
jgi:Fe-S-cluster-containing dehydrogenase component/formate-dependent nitrite reductase membrane component NrfD